MEKEQSNSKSKSATMTMAKIAVLTALSYVLYMFVKFPLPMLFPAFLDIQFSDLPALLGGFSLGPVAGCAIIVIKCLLKMPFTSTACVGEVADIIIGLAFVLPASLIYRAHKNKKGAILGLLAGSLASMLFAALANRFLLIPFYVQIMFEGNWQVLLNMVGSLYRDVTIQNFYEFYIFLGIVPFNILRCGVTSVLTFFLYKRLSPILHR